MLLVLRLRSGLQLIAPWLCSVAHRRRCTIQCLSVLRLFILSLPLPLARSFPFPVKEIFSDNVSFHICPYFGNIVPAVHGPQKQRFSLHRKAVFFCGSPSAFLCLC